MQNNDLLNNFRDRSYYSAHFMDSKLWEPFIHRVVMFHGFDSQRITPGLAGTFPTFIVELDRSSRPALSVIVIKFFGPLFDGPASFLAERAIGHFLSQQQLGIHTPVILAEGYLNPEWTYLMFEYIPGVSIGQVRAEISANALEGVAQQLGSFMRELHTLTVITEANIPLPVVCPGWEEYAAFLNNQREACLNNHRIWQDLPAHLIEQIPGFILPIDHLIDQSSAAHLIHADLTADHLLGRLLVSCSTQSRKPADVPIAATGPTQSSNSWESLAVIDWGDCRVGNILYELVALHMDLFQADKYLLRVCLDAYGLPAFYQIDFARKALSTVLLHQFPMPAHLYSPYRNVPSLYELAEGIFGV